MKYLAFIFLLFLTSISYAQVSTVGPTGSANQRTIYRGGEGFQSYIGLPRLDSSGWGTSGIHSDLYVRKSPDSLLMRWNPVTHLDEPVGGGGIAGSNFYYNSDTLSNDRQVTANGNDLFFLGKGVSAFGVNGFSSTTIGGMEYLFLRGGANAGLNVYAPGVGIFGNSASGGPYWQAILRTTNLTGNHNFEFPNAPGTLATREMFAGGTAGQALVRCISCPEGWQWQTISTGAPSFATETYGGAGMTYTISTVPLSGSVQVLVNGIDYDYIISGTTITIDAPLTIVPTDKIKIRYQH